MSPSSSPPRQAETWIAQLREAQQLLRADPKNSQAWRWRIRAKVLLYLVLRYGGDPPPEVIRFAAPVRPLLPIRDLASDLGSPIRTRRELQEILLRIAEINREKAPH